MVCVLFSILPFLSFFFLGFFARFFGRFGSVFIGCFFMLVSFVFSGVLFFMVLNSCNFYYVNLGVWLYSEFLFVFWEFLFDSLSCVMCLVVCSISLCVHFKFFSIGFIYKKFKFFNGIFKLFFICVFVFFNFFL